MLTEIRNRFLPLTWLKRHPLVSAGLIYLGLVCLAYPSLTLNFSSAIPGIKDRQGDYAIFYWNIWWFQHALFQLGQDPFFTNYIFYPHTVNLAYHMFSPFLDAAALPITVLFGPGIGFNSVIYGSLVFSGLAMLAFLRRHAVPIGLAFIGGLLFIFNSFATARVSMSQLDMLPMGFMPLGLLAWDWLAERRRPMYILILSGVLYAAFMSDFQFALWLGPVLSPYALYTLIRADRVQRGQLFLRGALAAALLIGLVAIAPLPQWLAGRSASYPPISYEAAELEGVVSPIDLIGIPPRLIESDAVTLGVLLPLLIVVSVIRGERHRSRWAWLLAGAGFVVLAFGPTLHPDEIPLPYRIVHLALGNMYRAPGRFMLPALLALIVFVVISLRSAYRRLNERARYVLMAGVIVALAIENRWFEPFPFFTMPDYRIYHALGADPAEYLVLEVPVGPYNNMTEAFGHGAELQYYAVYHHKQLINGNVSRAPAGTTHDYRQWKLITALAEERPIPDLDTARREFQQLSHDWDMRYAIVHRDMLAPETANWAAGFFNTQAGWCLVDEEGPVLAYHRLDGQACATTNLLDPPPDGTINLGDEGDDRYLGLGWYLGENVGGPQARWTGAQPSSELRVHLAVEAYRVTIHATAYVAEERVVVKVNGVPLVDLAIGAADWGLHTFDLPANLIPADGVITLTFTSSRSQSAYDRTNGQIEDKRLLAVAYDSIQFEKQPYYLTLPSANRSPQRRGDAE
jgi:hypothetical protein